MKAGVETGWPFSTGATPKSAACVTLQALAITPKVREERVGPHHTKVACDPGLCAQTPRGAQGTHITLPKLASAQQGWRGFPREIAG